MYGEIRLVVQDKDGNVVMDRNIQDMVTIYEGYTMYLTGRKARFTVSQGVKFVSGSRPITSPAEMLESFAVGCRRVGEP